MPGGWPASRSAADAGWRRRFCENKKCQSETKEEVAVTTDLRLDVAVDDVL